MRRAVRGTTGVGLLLLAFAVGTPGFASAQEAPAGPIRAFGGVDLIVAAPTGEFAENVRVGFGLEAHARTALGAPGIASLRIDLGFLNYGNETIRICVTQPCRVTGDLTTSNNILFLGVGPELAADAGRIRMYGNGGVGLAWFNTTSSASGSSDTEPFASSTNHSDVTFAWLLGGGVQIRIAQRQAPIYLDLGARYHGNGEAEYLRKGDIYDLPDGSVVVDPQRGDTNFWTFRIGVAVGFGRAGAGAADGG